MFGRMVPALAGWLVLSLASVLALTLGKSAWGATLYETSELLAANAEAAAQLPPTYEFTLARADNYTVTLSDLGEPDALGSLQALITRDLQAVAELEVKYPTTAGATIEPATATFAGTPGSYRVHVLGKIPAGRGGGTFGITVAPSAGGTAVLTKVAAIAVSAGPGDGQSQLQTTFNVSSSGMHQLTVTDRAFPAVLARTQVLLLRQVSGGAPQIVLQASGAFNATAGDTFELIIVATAGAGQAGLYGVSVTSPANASIYRSENAVGQLPPATAVDIANAGSYVLTLADLQFPVALTSMSVAVMQNGSYVGGRNAAGSSDITLAQGVAQLFVFNKAQSTGVMSVNLAQGNQVAYADVHLADASPDATTPSIYSFTPSQPVSAGNHKLTVVDFRFPSPISSIDTAVVRQGAIVQRANGAVENTFALQDGPVRVLVAVTPPPAVGALPGNGMLALTLTTQPANAIVFESTQGVGGLFISRPLSVPATGRYDVILKDYEFPDRLRTSWLAVTRGTTLVAQVIGSSSIQNLQFDAGTHILNFLGQPAANASYGAFGMKVADSTPAPVVTLSASPTSITSGGNVTLTWSATNATSCTAAGGWSGSKVASGPGTETINGLTANATYDIECIGPGGRDDASVTVNVNAPSKGKGGGGQLDPLLLISMLMMLAAAKAVQAHSQTHSRRGSRK